MAGMRIAEAVEAAIAANRIVGAVVAIAHRGRTVMLEAFGAADREAGRAMTADSVFLLASATKPIATAAILALAEQGTLDLDAPVTTWLPAFRPAFEGTAPLITLRHLLTHTSGLSYPFRELPDGPYHRAGVVSGISGIGVPADEQLRRLGSVPLLFMPGSRWEYSLGVDVAGFAAARAAGESLPDLVARHITGPLGMDDTAFAVRDRARLVAHYGIDAAGAPLRMSDGYEGPSAMSPALFDPSRLFHPASYASAGGGMAGTAADLLAFIEMLRQGGRGILPSAVVAQMTRNALPLHIGDALEPGWGYGLGTEVLVDSSRSEGPELPGAFKGSGAYGHRWLVDPSRELSAVILTNTAPEGLRGAFAPATRTAIYDTCW